MDKSILFSIARLRFLKTPEKLLLADCIRDESRFLRLTLKDIASLVRRMPRRENWNSSEALRQGERDCRTVDRMGIRICRFTDPEYPVLLKEIFNPPFLLFYRGTLPDGERPAAAVVGTRRPSGKASKAAYRFALELSVNGIASVSGLARGIDKAVHRGSLDGLRSPSPGSGGGNGRTYAVLGCGIDRIYPNEHKMLAEEIAGTGGAVISEYAPGIAPLRYHFPERNRIISGMARGTVVIQAPEKSGALITAEYALDQGRDLYVHREGLDGRSGKGCRDLICCGAPVLDSGTGLLTDWDIAGKARVKEERPVRETGTDTETAGLMLSGLIEKEMAGKLHSRMGRYWEII